MVRPLVVIALVAGCAAEPRPRAIAAPPAAEAPATPPPDASAAPVVVDPERVPFDADARAEELAFVRDALRDTYAHLETKQRQWGIDLDELFARYEPRIRAAETWTRYERVMVELVSELHDGHLQWRRRRGPSETKRRVVRLGLSTQLVGDELIVSEVWPGSDAERAGVRRGDRILSIDDQPVADRLAGLAKLRSWSRIENARYEFAQAWPASRSAADAIPRERTLELELRDGTRDALAIVPETSPRPGGPRPKLELDRRGTIALLSVRSLDRSVADTRRIARELAEEIFAEPHGLVVDLRGNKGGYELGALAIVSELSPAPVVGGSTRVRLSAHARERQVWRDLPEDPERPGWSVEQPLQSDGLAARAYPGAIAVLVDAGCQSSCETLALLLRTMGARLFGETTGGTGGAPIKIALPHSGARLAVPARAAFDRAGEPIEGRGVAPDEVVTPTRDDVAAARDVVLERGIAHVSKKPKRARRVRSR
jgi:carboxyl-terminal processing protease